MINRAFTESKEIRGKSPHPILSQRERARIDTGFGKGKVPSPRGRRDLGMREFDPLWEKYYSWSPYQYSGNNPIRLFDDGGDIVKAMDEASRDNIINSVEKQYRKYVKFKFDG